MELLKKSIRGFFGFWYKFIIGDDWAGAAGVLILLIGTWVLLHFGITAYWYGPTAIAITAVILVARGLRRKASRITS